MLQIKFLEDLNKISNSAFQLSEDYIKKSYQELKNEILLYVDKINQYNDDEFLILLNTIFDLQNKNLTKNIIIHCDCKHTDHKFIYNKKIEYNEIYEEIYLTFSFYNSLFVDISIFDNFLLFINNKINFFKFCFSKEKEKFFSPDILVNKIEKNNIDKLFFENINWTVDELTEEIHLYSIEYILPKKEIKNLKITDYLHLFIYDYLSINYLITKTTNLKTKKIEIY